MREYISSGTIREATWRYVIRSSSTRDIVILPHASVHALAMLEFVRAAMSKEASRRYS